MKKDVEWWSEEIARWNVDRVKSFWIVFNYRPPPSILLVAVREYMTAKKKMRLSMCWICEDVIHKIRTASLFQLGSHFSAQCPVCCARVWRLDVYAPQFLDPLSPAVNLCQGYSGQSAESTWLIIQEPRAQTQTFPYIFPSFLQLVKNDAFWWFD